MDQLRRDLGFRRIRGFDWRRRTMQGRSFPQSHRKVYSADAGERLQGADLVCPLPASRGARRGMANLLSLLRSLPRSLGSLGVPRGARIHEIRDALLWHRVRYPHFRPEGRGSGDPRYTSPQFHRQKDRARPRSSSGIHAFRRSQAVDQLRLGTPDHAKPSRKGQRRPHRTRAVRLYEAGHSRKLLRLQLACLKLRDRPQALPRRQ